MQDFHEIRKIVQGRMSEYRFFHSECVAARCVELAAIYGADSDSARLIGIVHDIAKEMPNEEKLQYCKENGVEIDEMESGNLGLLHGKIGADIARREFGFSEDLCSAIRYHTTGKANMSLLDKILYVADMTSQDRQFPDKEKLIKMGNNHLDECVKYILKLGIMSRIEQNKKVHLNSMKALNFLMD